VAGKAAPKKDLAWMAMTYGSVCVARVAFGAKDAQTVKALQEAESYPGPSLILAYSPCIAHGFDLGDGLDHQQRAVATGYWPLCRFDPRSKQQGKPALRLDSAPPKGNLGDALRQEGRFTAVEREDPARFATLLAAAEQEIRERWERYEKLAKG
jgi:pyruvate-ferredoxin/flavodoxin oxidoreductase